MGQIKSHISVSCTTINTSTFIFCETTSQVATSRPSKEKHAYRHESNDSSKKNQERKAMNLDTSEETEPIAGEKGLHYE